MTFNPEKHLMELQGKAYLEVKWRIVWFRQECPAGSIKTEEVLVDLDREVEAEVPTGNWIPNPNRPGKKMPEKMKVKKPGYARFRAIIDDSKGGHAEATKTEYASAFDDYAEKAETGAIGRALALLGYGTAFTGDELNEEHRIVDAPVERANSFQYGSNGNSNKTAATSATNASSQQSDEKMEAAPATEQQLSSLRRLYDALGREDPDDLPLLRFTPAKERIGQLKAEYQQQLEREAKRLSARNEKSENTANRPLTEQERNELIAAYAVTYGVDGPEIARKFEALVKRTFQGAVKVEGLTYGNGQSLKQIFDAVQSEQPQAS